MQPGSGSAGGGGCCSAVFLVQWMTELTEKPRPQQPVDAINRCRTWGSRPDSKQASVTAPLLDSRRNSGAISRRPCPPPPHSPTHQTGIWESEKWGEWGNWGEMEGKWGGGG